MKAVICTGYGAPEVLKIAEVERPVPKDDELLVRVMAAALNYGDTRVRKLEANQPLKFFMRFVLGFTKPRKPILGSGFSGVVEQAGKNVKDFKIGDEVYGMKGFKMSAHAEFTTVSEKKMVSKKPSNATFEEAAAILLGAHTSISFLEKAKIKERTNPKIMIYGATGSVGTAAIQIAWHFGARVTAVCSEAGSDLVKKLGVTDMILYDKEDFTKRKNEFDIVFDAVGKTSKSKCRPLLKENGSFVTVAGPAVAKENVDQLVLLRELFEAGKYDPTIDKVFTMEEIVEAHRYVDTGRKKGNVVITIQRK